MIFDGWKLGQVGSWVCPIFRLGQKLRQDLWSEDGAARSQDQHPIFRPMFGQKMGQTGLKTGQVGRWGTTCTQMTHSEYMVVQKMYVWNKTFLFDPTYLFTQQRSYR